MSKEMSPLTLKTILQSEKAAALAAVTASTLVQDRSRALNFYNGKMSNDMPAEDGRSEAVSMDVADTIEGLLPSLLEIFAGAEEVVRFDPQGPEDVEAAQQETDYVNHVFMQQNEGFLILYTMIKDALLEKVGVVKIMTEEEETEHTERYFDQTDDQFMMLVSDPNIEVVAHTEHAEGGITLHDMECVTRKKIVKHIVENIPPEQFGISRSAKSIKKANYCYHEVMRSESEAIEQGFDPDQIKSLPTWVMTAWSTGVEAVARDTVNESTTSGSDPGVNEANRQIKITEHYVMLDYNGDGKAKRYRVTTGGDQGEILRRNGKLDIEEVEYNPFAAATPVIMPHRFFGKSIADLVMDIQKIKTALVRGQLDNIYLHNNARVEVAEEFAGPDTLDDLLVSRPGGIIRTRRPGGLQWQVVPDITQSIYPAIEYWDQTREWRTGVSKQGQGLDPDVLQNQSATAASIANTASQARMRLIARIFAETGIRDLFSLLHGEIRRYGDAQSTLRLRNQWVTVNPRDWKERNDMTINVGLGSGSKPERIAALMGLINLQSQAIQAGKTNLVDDGKLFNSFKEYCRILEYKDPTMFANDPTERDQQGNLKYPPPPPPVDPKLQIEQIRQQGKQQENQQKGQIELMHSAVDAHHQQVKTQGEVAAAQVKAELDAKLAILEAKLKAMTEQQQMVHREREHQLNVVESVVGMAHDHQKHEQSLELMRNKPAKTDA